MTKRVRRLSVVAVVLAGSLLLGGALWWHSRSWLTFPFLSGQQPIHRYRDQNSRVDTYCFPGDFESMRARMSKELLRKGFVDTAPPGMTDFTGQDFCRRGYNRTIVRLYQGKSEIRGDGTVGVADMPGWVTVAVGQRRATLREYLLDHLPRRLRPLPKAAPSTVAKP